VNGHALEGAKLKGADAQWIRNAVSAHPLFIASLFVLHIYRQLIPFADLKELFRDLLTVLACVVAVQFAFAQFYRRPFKAALATSLAVIFFCSFGGLKTWCDGWVYGTRWIVLGRARWLLVIEAIVFLLVLWKLARTHANLLPLQRYLNVVTGVLVLSTGATILFAPTKPKPDASAGAQIPLHAGTHAPDIYYILTDARTSSESLQAYWGYDDSAFVKFLAEKGFHVIKNARANSTATAICLSTSLNMNYPKLETRNPYGVPSVAYYGWTIKHAEAPARLQASGYDVTALSIFATGGQPRYYHFPRISASSLADVLWETSIIGHFSNYRRQLSLGDTNLKILSMLPEIAAKKSDRPKFVYAHLIMPHAPYLFDQNGRRIIHGMTQVDDRPEFYLGQLIYQNSLLTNAISAILKNSQTPPIIVVQGDHGYRNLPNGHREQEALTILNALYLPGSKEDWLYPGITPANTFRLIFNHYFGEHYPYLPDISCLAPSPLGHQDEAGR
jgi:hypothetical protein